MIQARNGRADHRLTTITRELLANGKCVTARERAEEAASKFAR